MRKWHTDTTLGTEDGPVPPPLEIVLSKVRIQLGTMPGNWDSPANPSFQSLIF